MIYTIWRQSLYLFEQCDAPRPWGLYFQDSASPQMEALVELHDNIMFYLVIILFAVGWILTSTIVKFIYTKSPISHKYVSHGTLVELIWTITPGLILIFIAFTSFKLLYLMDEVSDINMTLYIEGFLINGGPKSYMKNKIENTFFLKYNAEYRKGQKNKVILKQLFHSKVNALNRIGPHNEEVISVIIGSLLGDGYANKRNIEGIRLCYRQSVIHKEYLFWLYEFFYNRGYCSPLNPRLYVRRIKNKVPKDSNSNTAKEYHGYEFNTFTFRSFNWIHKMFYKQGKKYISPTIKNYLNAQALAIWLMDDGAWAKPGVRIATNSFELQQVIMLSKIIHDNFSLECTVQHLKSIDRWSIYIKGKSIPALRKIVLAHFHSSMHYKLGLK